MPTESPVHLDCVGTANYELFFTPDPSLAYTTSGVVAAAHDRYFWMFEENESPASYGGLSDFITNADLLQYENFLEVTYPTKIDDLDHSRYYPEPTRDFFLVST